MLPCFASNSSKLRVGLFSSGALTGGSSLSTISAPPITASSPSPSSNFKQTCMRMHYYLFMFTISGYFLSMPNQPLICVYCIDKAEPNLVLVRVIVQPNSVLLQREHVIFLCLDGKTDGGKRGCDGTERRRNVDSEVIKKIQENN